MKKLFSGKYFALIVTVFFVVGGFFASQLYVFAVVNPTPSTNDANRTNSWAHVDQISQGVGTTDLKFISTRPFASCFEYRTDGDTSQMTNPTNYNSLILDGLYPYHCKNNSDQTYTFNANNYVEVRMVFGAESDERFDWTRFDVLPPPSIGSIEITKYVCPADTSVIRSANGVGGTVPEGCVPDSGKTFGYVHGEQTDANGPYPELSAPLTAGGATNDSGVLTIGDLPATGRYLVVETNSDNQKIPDGDILGLYCVGDGDTSDNNDNQELTFVPADGTVKCVAYNKASVVLTSTVTMCKQSDTEQALSGWTLMLKGDSVEDLSVNSNAIAGQNTSNPLVAGASYIATAVGTWLNQGGTNAVDAEYSTTNSWSTHTDGYPTYQNDILELQIDNEFDPGSSWGAYNSLHTYVQSFIPSTTFANFRMFDGTGVTPDAGWYNDNSGSLAVNVSKGFAGITGENGCVTFTGVPYGSYTADEVMQDGWVHNSESDDYGTVVVDGPEETFTIINYDNDVPAEPTSGKVHIYKFINGEQATAENADGASFPMITPTYGNAPFTLDSDGWTEGDAPYEASTSTIEANGTYTAYENTETSLVGTSCKDGKPYALVGYSSGTSLEGAIESEKSETAPTVTVDGDQYIIVWNEACDDVEDPTTLKVHIYKYLDNGEAITQVPNDSTAPEFPMSASWDSANIGSGTGSYVLGNNHGGTALKYAADTTAMESPADYTTYEVTSAETDFLPIESECVDGKYRLLGYKSSTTSLSNAESASLSTEAPNFTDLTSDAYIIVVNEKCGEVIVIDECLANEADIYVSDETTMVGDGTASAVTPHEAWTASIPGATWIYSAPLNEAGSSPTGDMVFTKTFTITDTPTDSTLDIASDNMYSVSVNGVPLATGTSATDLNNFSTADSWTIPATSLQTGSNTVTITVTNPAVDPNNPEVTFADPNPAGLLFKITINSEDCPENLAPIADAGSDQSITLPTDFVTLNGSGIDTDGTITTYAWSGAGGTITSPSSSTTNVTGLSQGSHTFTLTVTDNDGATDTDDVIITVNPAGDDEEDFGDTECTDGKDNDGDGLTDMNDSGCSNEEDNQEENTRPRGSGSQTGQVLGASTGPVGQVLGASTSACPAQIDKFLRRGYLNDSDAVKQLQNFLNDYQQAGLKADGNFGIATERALKKFQLKHEDTVLGPWGMQVPTGIFYITSQIQVNNILCPDLNLQIPNPLIPFEQNPLSPKKK